MMICSPLEKAVERRPEPSTGMTIGFGRARKAMRRILIITISVGFAIAAAGPVFSQQEQVAFKLTGGLVFIQGDDYNKGIAGQNQLLRDTSLSLSGGYKKLNTGGSLYLEIVNYWGPHFGVGIGGGYYQIANQSGVSGETSLDGGSSSFTSTFSPTISAIPFFLNIHYKTRITPRIGIDAFGGPVFQIVQFGFRRQDTATAGVLSEIETFKASANDLGAQVGLDLNVHLFRGLSLVVEGLFRAAKISNFKGNWLLSTTTSSGTVTTTSSSYYLWYYELVGNGVYPHFGFFDINGPTGAGLANARRGELNLTGFQALIGIKLSI